MNINKLFIVIAILFVAFGCQEDKNGITSPTKIGDEVEFGAFLDNSTISRTIYDWENATASAYPINWLKGDRVFIASPQCLSDNNTATYQVSDEANNKNYSDDLYIVGEGGVQWGTAVKADFYSIYPQRLDDEKYTITTENCTSFKLNMPNEQTNIIAGETPKMTTADMNACFMYAKAKNISSGSSVDLEYIPLSTAIRFTLNGPSQDGKGSGTIHIKKIILHAPVPIAGGFMVDLSGSEPIVSPASSACNDIIIYNKYVNQSNLTLTRGQSIELNAFIIPIERVINDQWSIEVILTTNQSLKKSLKPNSESSTKSTTLKPFKIHNLASLPAIDIDADPKPGSWMENLPRNAFLSEISMPGTWNSLNSEYQITATSLESGVADLSLQTLINQYNIGCRAFHFDTRWKSSVKDANGYVAQKNVSELSIDDGSQKLHVCGYFTMGDMEILPADIKEGYIMNMNAPTLSSVLNTLTELVGNSEYAIVMCSFARKSYVKSSYSWMSSINTICSQNDKIIDANNLNKDTTVRDVLGKVIVIINTEKDISKVNLPAQSKCIYTYLPFSRSRVYYPSETSSPGYFNKNSLYVNKSAIDITLNNTLAQVTYQPVGSTPSTGVETGTIGYAPSFIERERILENLLTWSKDNHCKQDYGHDAWMFLGLGGFITENNSGATGKDAYKIVASTLGKWFNDKISGMTAESGYYPVGIDLLNRVEATDTYDDEGLTCKDVIKNVIQLNFNCNLACKEDSD